MIKDIAILIFFGTFAINYWLPFAWAMPMLAISAAVIAVCAAVSLAKQ